MSALKNLKSKLGVAANPAKHANPVPPNSRFSKISRGVPIEKTEIPISHPARAARARVVQLLKNEPGLAYAAEVVDPDADPVRVVIAARGAGICELLIAGDKFDPIKFLEMCEKNNNVRPA